MKLLPGSPYSTGIGRRRPLSLCGDDDRDLLPPSCPSRRPKRDNVAFFSRWRQRSGWISRLPALPPESREINDSAVERARAYIEPTSPTSARSASRSSCLAKSQDSVRTICSGNSRSPRNYTRAYIRARKSERLKVS